MKLNEAREILYKYGIPTASKKLILRWIENDKTSNWYIVRMQHVWRVSAASNQKETIAKHRQLLYALTICLAQYLEL